MGLEARKLQFIEEYLRLENERIIRRLEEVLKQERIKEYESSLSPMSVEELEQRARESEADIEAGRVYSHEEVKAYFKRKQQ